MNNADKAEKEVSARQKVAGVAAIVAYFVAGIFLLIFPSLMVTITMWAIIVILAVYGIFKLISYFRQTPEEGASGYSFAAALLAFSLAAFIAVDSTSFASIFPHLWGLLLLVSGYAKIQEAIDTLRLKSKHWWLMLIGAAISIVLGIISITRPTAVLDGVAIFIGICLLVEAVVDLVLLIMMKQTQKR